MNALKIKKGDTVVVISGKDRGKRGKVVRTEADTGKLVVEGVNMATMHKKPRSQQDQKHLFHGVLFLRYGQDAAQRTQALRGVCLIGRLARLRSQAFRRARTACRRRRFPSRRSKSACRRRRW